MTTTKKRTTQKKNTTATQPERTFAFGNAVVNNAPAVGKRVRGLTIYMNLEQLEKIVKARKKEGRKTAKFLASQFEDGNMLIDVATR